MSEELKLCPYCGGEARAMPLIIGPTVQCMACGATQGIFGSAEEAAKAWNRRIADERVRELVEFVEEVAGLDCANSRRGPCGVCLYCRARTILRWHVKE